MFSLRTAAYYRKLGQSVCRNQGENNVFYSSGVGRGSKMLPQQKENREEGRGYWLNR